MSDEARPAGAASSSAGQFDNPVATDDGKDAAAGPEPEPEPEPEYTVDSARQKCLAIVDLISTHYPMWAKNYVARTLEKGDVGVEHMAKGFAHDTGRTFGWSDSSDEFKQALLEALLATDEFKERLLAGAAAAGIGPLASRPARLFWLFRSAAKISLLGRSVAPKQLVLILGCAIPPPAPCMTVPAALNLRRCSAVSPWWRPSRLSPAG